MDSPPQLPLAALGPDSAKTNGTSIFAFIASLSGYVCFLGVGGALGVVLGLIARSEISRAQGRETGRGLATAAIALGMLNVCLVVIGTAAGIAYLARPPSASAARSTPTATAPVWGAPSVAPRVARPSSSPQPPVRASREAGTTVTSLGQITIADLSGDFEPELDNQRTLAGAAGETLVLWLVVHDCKPCDGVAAALTSREVQKALAKVRLVRVDRDDFQPELDRLGIPTEKIPGFALLDSRGRARDFIHGGEWDADIAANIAPVLGKFARGGYAKRRHPWRAPMREDETQL
ncbi:MAG TPA: DUF4190 domain-containing protein [Polyangiaceae bacterium]|nr:DUF4190 domain-containing protein [Polyangiaceae bacterium]